MAKIEAEEYLPDPRTLGSEEKRPELNVQDVLRLDTVPPPKTLLESSNYTLGTDSIEASRYFSQEFADLEARHLWPKVWQFACWEHDIPNAGDISVYRILDRSVLIVRQRDMSIKAFVNACLHRGRELCSQDAHKAELRCPYHGYTWALEGHLKWTPSKWDFPQVDEKAFSLPQIKVDVWNGFVFVNFDDEAPPLKKHLGKIVEQWEAWDFSSRYKSVHVEKRIKCNWKAGQDAFIEAFHTFSTHSQGVGAVPDDCAQHDVYPDDPHVSRFHVVMGFPSPRIDPAPLPEETFDILCSRFLPEAVGTEAGKMKEGETPRSATARIARVAYANRGVNVDDLSDAELLDPVSYFVFPNFMPWPHIAYPLVYRFRPDSDPDYCIWETMLFQTFSGERPPSGPHYKLDLEDRLDSIEELGALGLVLQQDAEQLPLVQSGMKNLASGQLVLSEYQEVRIRHFHRTLEYYLGIE